MNFCLPNGAINLHRGYALALLPVSPAKPFYQPAIFADTTSLRNGFNVRYRTEQLHGAIVRVFSRRRKSGENRWWARYAGRLSKTYFARR